MSEGQHMPMMLSRLLSGKGKKGRRLKDRLFAFGRNGGLFDSISVKRFGESASDPFQLIVSTGKTKANLIDVGYGVSQSLPIIVHALMVPKDNMILLQQPEVHLHPRAQAELGSFIGTIVAEERRTFVLETHSDYIIDRIRLDIRDKRTDLKATDVVILYFWRTASGVKISRITFDDRGNLKGAPSNYRSFFLREQKRLFGI